MGVCFNTVKPGPVLSGHSRIDKKVLKTNDSFMKVESIAECSLSLLFEWPLKTGFTQYTILSYFYGESSVNEMIVSLY